MTSMAKKRLLTEYKHFIEQNEIYLYVNPKQNNILQWEALIIGPPETIWDGATLKLILNFSEEYPNKPPEVQFLAEVYHPNVYSNGKICLDILTNTWTPIYDVHAVLLSIQSLLTDPNPNSPANNEASKLFIEDREKYNQKVIECVTDSWKVK